MVEVTTIDPIEADLEAAEALWSVRSGAMDKTPLYVAKVIAAARLEGIRLGLEAAAKAITVAQYDPAPYTAAKHAIAKLDPASIG